MQEETKIEDLKPEVLINPIDGLPVDEVVKQREAKERGYLEPEFYFRYLEDENEFVKLFIINGKRIIVDMEKPTTQYKKNVLLNQERVLQEPTQAKAESCNISEHDGSCEMCSG